jgi:hypothetical protein
MVSYRLRIELPDRPGALAGVTGAIGVHDANIVSIDVHEIDGDTAVDEIVVAVDDDWAPGPLAFALADAGVGTLLSSRRITAIDDPMVGALEAVAVMIGGDQDALDAACCAAVLSLAHGASARMLDVDAAGVDPAGRMALDRGGAIVSRADDDGGAPGWVLAALDDPDQPRTVALVTRPLNVRFSATEVSRVEALLQVRRALLTSRAVAP